jgi:hypothetical protein
MALIYYRGGNQSQNLVSESYAGDILKPLKMSIKADEMFIKACGMAFEAMEEVF